MHLGDLAEQDMQREPHRQVQNNPDHRCGDRRKCAGEPAIGA